MRYFVAAGSLLLSLLCVYSAPAAAYLTSDYDFGIAYLDLDVKAGSSFSQTLNTPETIFFNYCINLSGPDIAYTMSFMESLSTDFGALAFTRLGIGARWYVLGINGAKIIFDDQTTGRSWKPSPFFGLNLGITNLSFKTDPSLNSDFNASAIDAQVVAGVEVPISITWMLTGQFGGLTTVAGGSSAQSTPGQVSNHISYSGFSILVGLKASTF